MELLWIQIQIGGSKDQASYVRSFSPCDMPRLGLSAQGPDPDEEEENNRERRSGVLRTWFADDTGVEPVAATATARRRPFSARTSRRRRRDDDVGRRGGGASARAGEQSAACVRESRCCAPRTAALLRTVQRGDYGTLSRLLGQSHSGRGEQVGSADTSVLGALLIEASGREHLDCMELLIQSMACKPKRNLKRQGYYPMHTAAGAGTLESMELLISAGLSPKTRDQGGQTPLHHASAHGSAECASFLCVIAGSTLLSHDKGAGDTPLHFAVRAGHSVCAEVLLSHAREDLLHETNAEGETPLDLARTVGDETLWRALQDGDRRRHHALANEGFLYSRYQSDAGASHSNRGGAVDVGRIMAVWERFFENAALVAVGSSLAGVADGNTEDDEGRQYRSRAAIRGAERKSNGVCELNDDGETIDMVKTHRGSAPTRNGWGGTGGGSWSNGGNEYRDNNQCHLESQEIRGTEMPGALIAPRTRFCAWEPVTDTIALDRNNYPDFPPEDLTPLRTGNIPSQVADDTHETHYSDDADLFQTPNCDSGDWMWPTDNRQGDTQFSFELPANNGTICTDEAATFGSCPPHQEWITCWDAASEAVYYWDRESGSSTWDITTAPVGVTVSSGVWDPQQEAFFTVDGSGASHWLVQSPAASATSSDERWIGTGTVNVSVAVDAEDRHNSANSHGLMSHLPQELEMVMPPSSEGNDSFYAALSEEEVYPNDESGAGEGVGGEMELPAVEHSHPNAWQIAENEGRYDEGLGLIHAQEQGSYHPSMPQPGVAEDGSQPIDRTDSTGICVGTRSSPEGAAPTQNMDVQEIIDGVDFFDSNNGEDHDQTALENIIGDNGSGIPPEQEGVSDTIETESTSTRLPKWLLWCAQTDDATPYYINEETGTRAWVLPPEAVISSGGWLRAWSEEHQAEFYANHWTGRVTWELHDVEVDSG